MGKAKGEKVEMEEISIIGVSRGSEYSPNHVDNNKSSYNSTYDTVKSYNSNTAGNPIIMRDKP
jgi:hypothetical protein